MRRLLLISPIVVVALGIGAGSSSAGDVGAAADQPTSVISVSLTAVREVPSRAFEDALRAKAFAFDNPVGSALRSDSEVAVIGRGRFVADGVERDLVVVRFRGGDGGRCWGVVVLTARGDPTSFTCDSEEGAFGVDRVTPGVRLATALLAASVDRLDIGTAPLIALSAESSVRADDGGTLRVWVLPLRSKTSVFDVVFRGVAGRPVGAFGVICLRKPAFCHERPEPPPKRRLILVTGSGRQREAAISESECGPNQGCAGIVVLVPGKPPRSASVVRLGERVRVLGMGADAGANLTVSRIATPCSTQTPSTPVARVAREDIGGVGKFMPLSPIGAWTADLETGLYAISTDVRLPKRTGGSTLHNGLFAILVSDTHPRGNARVPRC